MPKQPVTLFAIPGTTLEVFTVIERLQCVLAARRVPAGNSSSCMQLLCQKCVGVLFSYAAGIRYEVLHTEYLVPTKLKGCILFAIYLSRVRPL